MGDEHRLVVDHDDARAPTGGHQRSNGDNDILIDENDPDCFDGFDNTEAP